MWIAAFSLAAFAAILLGDARQHIVDVYVAAIAMVGFYLVWQKKMFLRIPVLSLWLWALTLISVAASSLWSDSAGMSLQSFLRYLAGFITFGLAYSVARHGLAEALEESLVIVSTVTTVVSGALLFTTRPTWLPSMNLLFLSFGHNHVVDLLLFVVPVALYTNRSTSPLRRCFQMLIFFGVIFSIARGAWLLVLFYGFVVMKQALSQHHKRMIIIVTLVLAGVTLLSVITPKPGWTGLFSNTIFHKTVQRLATKGSFLQDPRVEYWRQAAALIQERPFFGSGAGTFYFGSLRLQSRPGVYSWFAHSFPLQTIVELGIIGSLPVLALFGWTSWQLWTILTKRYSQWGSPERLAAGALLSLLYSFIEFNLSFIIIWIFFWLVAGVVVATNQSRASRQSDGREFVVPLGILVVFYLLLTAHNFMYGFFPKRTDIAFYLTPFDAVAAQQSLTAEKVSDQTIQLATLFHKNNPEMLLVVADAQEKRGDNNAARKTLERAILLNTLTEDVHQKYVTFLLKIYDYDRVARWVYEYSRAFFPVRAQEAARATKISAEFFRQDPTQASNLFDQTQSHEARFARLFYNAGLWYLPTQPDITRDLWKIAAVLLPELSDLWVERASLEEGVFRDVKQKDELLHQCLQEPTARRHCQKILNGDWLPRVGYFKNSINSK